MRGAVARAVDGIEHFAPLGQRHDQRRVAPLPVVADLHPFLAFAASGGNGPIHINLRPLEETRWLLGPDLARSTSRPAATAPQPAVTDGVNLLRDFVADPVGRKDRFPSLTVPAGAQPSGHLCFPFSEDCAMLFLHLKCLLSGLSEDSLSNSRIPVRSGISGVYTWFNPLPSTCFGTRCLEKRFYSAGSLVRGLFW